MKTRNIFFSIILISLFLSGCKKTETNEPLTNPTSSGSISYSFSDGYGVLVAVRSVSYQSVGGFNIPVEVNTATAAFPTSLNTSTFSDAGNVTINLKSLTKNSNNAYVYQNFTEPLTFNQISWNVSGSANVPAISYTENKPIPGYSGFESLPGSISRSAGLTVPLGSAISGADSVYVIVADYNGKRLLKRFAAGTTECSFPATELNGLAAGQGMLQVVPWNYKIEDYKDKNFYFIVESAFTKMNVTIN